MRPILGIFLYLVIRLNIYSALNITMATLLVIIFDLYYFIFRTNFSTCRCYSFHIPLASIRWRQMYVQTPPYSPSRVLRRCTKAELYDIRISQSTLRSYSLSKLELINVECFVESLKYRSQRPVIGTLQSFMYSDIESTSFNPNLFYNKKVWDA